MGRAVRIDRRGLSQWCGASDLVRLGSLLHDFAYPVGLLGTMRSLSASEAEKLRGEIGAVEERLTAMAHDKTKRDLRAVLGLAGSEVLDPLVLRVVAFASYYAMSRGIGTPVHTIARAASMLDAAELLEARRAIREIISQGEVLVYEENDLPMGDLKPGRKLVRLLNASGLDIVWTKASIKREKDVFDRMIASHEAEVRRQAAAKPAPPAPRAPPRNPPHTARELFRRLRETVVGMDPTVMEFAAAMAAHARRVELIRAGQPAECPPKTVLLVGASGSGKTLLAQAYARACGYHHVVVDLSQTTSAGYVGESVADAFETLWAKAGGAEGMLGGVCFWDELDKRSVNGRAAVDITGRGVQQELLKLVEAGGGWEYRVGGRNAFSTLKGTFDPAGLCHVFAGAFVGLADLAKGRLGLAKAIGFGGGSPRSGERTDIRALLNEFGIIPELTNRIERVILMPRVTMETLVTIATAPNGVIERQNRFVAASGLKLVFTEAAVREVCGWALATETLARGVRGVVGRLGDEAMAAEVKGEVKVDAADVRRAIEADSQALLG